MVHKSWATRRSSFPTTLTKREQQPKPPSAEFEAVCRAAGQAGVPALELPPSAATELAGVIVWIKEAQRRGLLDGLDALPEAVRSMVEGS